MTSYLSPLPLYPFPGSIRRRRSHSYANVHDTYAEEWTRPQPLLLHPLYSLPRRFYHLAGGHQPIVTDKHILPYLRRPSPPLPGWTLRHYSTQSLAYARPSTVDRYRVTSRIYPMDDWTERINNCLDDIGRTARSMSRWKEIKPEQRFMLRPMIPVTLCRSGTFIDTPIR
ncbi:hypothetical protein QQG55_18510 [Brugia pahangi]